MSGPVTGLGTHLRWKDADVSARLELTPMYVHTCAQGKKRRSDHRTTKFRNASEGDGYHTDRLAGMGQGQPMWQFCGQGHAGRLCLSQDLKLTYRHRNS